MKADYRLLIDNLLDLTHVTYIHKNTIAGDPQEALVPVSTARDGDAIRVERWMLGFTAPPMYDLARKFDEQGRPLAADKMAGAIYCNP